MSADLVNVMWMCSKASNQSNFICKTPFIHGAIQSVEMKDKLRIRQMQTKNYYNVHEI